MNRRDFFLRGATGLAALRNFPHHLFAGTTAKQASDRVKLGIRGVEVSRLAMGTGTNGVGGSSNQTRKMGVQGLADLFKFGFDHGFTFWDSADQYGTHLHMKAALKEVPRDKVAIMTKTHSTTAKEMREDLDRFRREIGTDYIDIVLLHAMADGNWPETRKGAMEVLSEAREKGIVRTHGTSCHNFEAMQSALKNPWCEVDLARINPAKVAMDADPQTILNLLADMKTAGKGVIGMKILGAGRRRSKPDECLQFALAHDQIDAFTIGAESVVELGDLLKKISGSERSWMMRTLLLTLGLALLTLAGCNRTTKKEIAVIPMGRSHVYWVSAHAGAMKAAEQEHVDILWNGPATESDFAGELEIVENMINRHVDAIALAPIDRKALANAVDRASAAGIPVIIWDSPVDSQKFVAQIATDNYAAGQLGADRMGEILHGKGRIAEVACQPGSASTMAREKGFEDRIKEAYQGIVIVDKRYGMADVAQSMTAAENMLTAHPNLDALFGSNESSTVGAARAITSAKSKVKLVGFDSSPILIDGLKDGVIDSLVTQNPFDMGYRAVMAAVEKLKGGTVERIQKLPAVVVTKANLEEPAIHARLFPDLDRYLKAQP